MRKLLLAILVGPVAMASADPLVIKGTYGFDVMKPKQKCVKVDGAVLKKLTKSFKCEAPADPKASASGKTLVAECPAKKGSSRYLLLADAKDCNEERETQLANGG
jgi:hypothetical protein